MQNSHRLFFAGALIILLAFIAFGLWGVPYLFGPVRLPQTAEATSTLGSQTVRARVTQIVDEGQIELNGRSQLYQVMQVEILEGDQQGMSFQIDYGKRQLRTDDIRFAPGDEVYVMIDQAPSGDLKAYYSDYVRSKSLAIMLIVFALSILVLGRWKGLGSLVALAISMVMIVSFILPHILAGEDPVKVSLIGSMILLGVTLYLTYGWNLKSHASVVSMILSLSLTGAFSAMFVGLTRLNGYGDENAQYLMQGSSIHIDPRGLLLAGMIIGALGVLGDLVTSQSAAVVELHDANPLLGFRLMFLKAMRVGQDHVAATVNTLVLAYAGASLPLLLIFTLNNGSYSYLINSEFLAEEIVRTLVGSLGLIAAVPISTLIATALIVHQSRLGPMRALLGPETADAHLYADSQQGEIQPN
ncbi:MAG TPA: YibE/F family protein [Anaerolineales bacterium]|nr:YibE/F family protein [Anaerolineales bacterium]